MTSGLQCKIGDACGVGDGAHASIKRTSDGIPYLMARNLKEGRISKDKLAFISEESFEKHFKTGTKSVSRAQENDVIFGIIGSIGGAYCVPAGDRFGLSSSIAILRPDIEKVDPNYLFHWISSSTFQDALYSIKGGVAQSYVSLEMIRSLPLSLPLLGVQKRIASILSAYDDLIENNTRRIAILEEMARRLYEEWLLPQFEEDVWIKAPFSETLAGHIGGGWGKETSDSKHQELAFVIRGTDIPRARVGDIANCPLRYHSASNLRSRALVDGDLVMEVSGGSKDQLVGRPLIVSNRLLNRFDSPVMCASFCKRLQVNRELISPLLLYHYLSKAYIDGTMAQFQVQSTGITNFQFKPFLEKAEVPIPPKELQARFEVIANPMRRQIELLGTTNANLRAQRDLLLPKLVSGEIDVTEAEIAMEAAE